MEITVRLFAKARDVAGQQVCTVMLPGGEHQATTTLGMVLKSVLARFPKLSTVLPGCSLAVNEEFVPSDTAAAFEIKDRDTVAILPPVSGG
jgi:molybdopterin converting factor small subunit